MTKIIAFDQATRTGWAFGTERTKFEFGSFKAGPKFMTQERLGTILDNMVSLIQRFEPEEIHYESPWHPNPEKLKSHWDVIQWAQKIEACVLLAGHITSVPAHSQAAGSWRLAFLGYGRRPKGASEDHMKKAAMARAKLLGYDVKNTDESDAIGILWHALHGKPGIERMQGNLLDLARERL